MSPPTVNSRSAFFASAALIASCPLSIMPCASVIHSPLFFARGTIMRRLPDSATVTAALRTAAHCASVLGLISSVPFAVSMVLTASHTMSAFGSTTDCISSLVSATGRNGGGSGPPQELIRIAPPRMRTSRAVRMRAMLPDTGPRRSVDLRPLGSRGAPSRARHGTAEAVPYVRNGHVGRRTCERAPVVGHRFSGAARLHRRCEQPLDLVDDGRPPVFAIDIGEALAAECSRVIRVIEQVLERGDELGRVAVVQPAVRPLDLSAQHLAPRVHQRRQAAVPRLEQH